MITEQGNSNNIHDSDEIDIGQNTTWFNKLISPVPALQNRNYKLYFTGQLISVSGTWLQTVAQGWLVLKLTNSAYYLGLIAAINSLPSLFLTLFGGVIVDRYQKKIILIFTQTVSMFLAFILGILTILNIVTVWEIAILSFLLGTVFALDSPARHAFIPEVVSPEQLQSAIALNSGIFNAARVIGPSLAGILIALTGLGGAFIINGISYIAVIVALMYMKIDTRIYRHKVNPLNAIKEGFIYAFTHPVIRTLMLLIAVTSIFGWSYTTILPLIVKNVYNLGAAGLGYFYAAIGSGAVLATIIIATSSKRISPLVFIIGGNMTFSFSIFCFSFVNNVHLALLILFLAGFGLISQIAMINTTIQRLVKNELRGRVMSIYILMFMGLTFIGNYLIGILAERFGTFFAIRLGISIVFLAGLTVYFHRKRMSAAYTVYNRDNL